MIVDIIFHSTFIEHGESEERIRKDQKSVVSVGESVVLLRMIEARVLFVGELFD